MLLAAAGIGGGDEVIFCSHTMLATASAIHVSGSVPVPVEAGADHLIDPMSIERAITSERRPSCQHNSMAVLAIWMKYRKLLININS
jgi:dTDP-4-amino-4,6-dideoxygalactose transaminase